MPELAPPAALIPDADAPPVVRAAAGATHSGATPAPAVLELGEEAPGPGRAHVEVLASGVLAGPYVLRPPAGGATVRFEWRGVEPPRE